MVYNEKMITAVNTFREAVPAFTETMTPERQATLAQAIRPLIDVMQAGIATMMPTDPNVWQRHLVGDVRQIDYLNKQNGKILRTIPSFEGTIQISIPKDSTTQAILTFRQEPQVIHSTDGIKPHDEIMKIAGKSVLATPTVGIHLVALDVSGLHTLEAELDTKTDDTSWSIVKVANALRGGKEVRIRDYVPDDKDTIALRTSWNLLFDTLGAIAVRVAKH